MTAPFKRVELTPTEEKLWSDTRVALLWHCPAFSHILYTMMDKADSKYIAVFTEDVPIAATDGTNLILNPKTFFKYNLSERIFAVVHEIMHCVWNHCGLMHQFQSRGKIAYPDGSSLPYSQELMNIATDLVINDCLIESKVGTFNKDWLHDKSIAVGTDSAIDAYKKVFKQAKGGGAGGTGIKGQGFDQHLAPGTSQGKDPQSASSERNEQQWKTEVAAGINAAKVMGKLPAGLERILGEILDPKVDWREHIQSLFARKVGSGTYDWQKPDRRLIVRDIYAPGRSGYGCGTGVVGVDTSGSICGKTLDMFFAEISGILEDLVPKSVVLIWCDAAVGRVDELEDAGDLNVVRGMGAPGGGGTSFIPVFDEIGKRDIEPDALVYLTDGYGTFPKAPPSFPVIWGSITPNGQVTYPFGDVVEIPQQVA